MYPLARPHGRRRLSAHPFVGDGATTRTHHLHQAWIDDLGASQYVPADDLTDPAAASLAHLDATTVLSRQIAELGMYPAVNPIHSTSRILDPQVIGDEHYKIARGVKSVLRRYRDLQDISPLWALTNCRKIGKMAVARSRKIQVSFRSRSMLPKPLPAGLASTEAQRHG